ncbi:MAG: PCMD domain-containing protein [Bacteroidales bacterium]|nr:PCMD domain-containing protein [Bacteroidales bacterium]
MKRFLLYFGAALFLTACSDRWNDLVHTEVPAYIHVFEVEGQLRSDVSTSDKTVSILLPYGTDVSALKITKLLITETAVCNPALKEGDVINLSAPLTVTLSTYDDYVWTVSTVIKPKPLSDIYNMSFDLWCRDAWDMYDSPYEDGADPEDRSVWGSINPFIAMLGTPVLFGEKEFLAVAGEGKAALKLQTRRVDMIDKTFPGTIITGQVDNFDTVNTDATVGIPFTKRPKSLDGYACYKPKESDKGVIFIALVDWTGPQPYSPPSKLLEVEKIPGLVGYGKKVYDADMSAYEPFNIDITYVSTASPKYVAILASSSEGDGVDGSVLYLDELGFSY